jgi:drug/metabolite transporter (DMT)-like permease
LLAGIVYVVAALLLKRAADLGADVWRTARVCNFTTALLFAPLALLGGSIPGWQLGWQPALVAVLFVAGQVFSLLALNIGDVSVATPVLGVKILLVALLTTTLTGEHIGARLWMAALLSSAAVALLNLTGRHPHHRVGTTIFLAALAAAAYALFDVLVQKWSPAWGAGRFLPLTMFFVAAWSVALRPLGRKRDSVIRTENVAARRFVLAGAGGLALQAILFVSSIALYGQATVANVLYSSRGLWSVLSVWLVGHWFANRERQQGRRVMAWRLVGAALLLAAIVIVLRHG